MTKNIKYLEKLKIKGLKTIPLANYINSSTKILHKCICGKSWNITPNNALKGKSCGCTNRTSLKTHEQYLEDLMNNNIKVIPIEKYNGIKTKILHKCICGDEWNVKPAVVLDGFKCGCIRKENKPFQQLVYKNRKTILYYIKVNNLYKIGITLFKKSIESSIYKGRFSKDIKKGVSIEIIKTKIFDNGIEAYISEQNILEKFKCYRYGGVKVITSGNTELFSEDILSKNLI